MIDQKNLSRRQFLQSSTSLAGTAYLRLMGPAIIAIAESACTAKHAASPFKVLGADEAGDFAAIAARLIPTTDTPGATEAGVIYFFDSAFAAEMSDQLEAARTGLAAFNAALNESYPDAGRLSSLSEDDQDAFLKTQESEPFFGLAWAMTIFGFFSMSKYGGNKDNIGWDLIGFEGDHGAWQYPFGYYDAQVHGEAKHGE
jgi:gluconate 2-dehydrogenase gamma chain